VKLIGVRCQELAPLTPDTRNLKPKAESYNMLSEKI
jgi:hypothetical protein